MDIQHVPHIRGECAKCHHIFDLHFGLDCPACKHVGLTGVAYKTETEIPHVLTNSGNYHTWDCPGCEAEAAKNHPFVKWLEELHALEDDRAEYETNQEQSAPVGQGE